MTTTYNVQLQIENIIPLGDESDSKSIVAVWKQAQAQFGTYDADNTSALDSYDNDYRFTLDLKEPLALFESAIAEAGSFNNYRQLHAENQDIKISALIGIKVTSVKDDCGQEAIYKATTIFQQQLYLAMNFAYPGACQLLGSRFIGDSSYLYEAQSYESKVFYDARISARESNWPKLHNLELSKVWQWLNSMALSHSDIAISDINKVLINMLKLGQQRHRYGSRSILIASQQIELLLGIKHDDGNRLRNRTRLILGDVPEAADCFIDLYRLRADLFHGEQPVRRPALICNGQQEERREQIAIHNTNVELAASIIVALIQTLISNNKNKFLFKEVLVEG